MQVLINQVPYTLPAGATLLDAIAAVPTQPPFAAALNLQFVPKTGYAQASLSDGDRVEIIAPVTGG
jgi:sulfur carrier protein